MLQVIKSGFKIMVIGDVMIDKYVISEHNRQSPEANIPLLNYIKTEERLGGAANVASNLKSLGCEVVLISVIGNDVLGSRVLEYCTFSGIESKFTLEEGRPTTCKTRYVDREFNQFMRLDHEIDSDIIDQSTSRLKTAIDSTLSKEKIDAIIIQDYNKGVITSEIIEFLKRSAKRESIPIAADPKTQNFSSLADSTIFKPNINELSAFAGHSVEIGESEIMNALEKSGINEDTFVFVTLAHNGIFFTKGKKNGIIPGLKVENPDVSGAGDTVIAVLTVGYLNGLSAQEMAVLANKSGALACNKRGIAQISIDEIENFKI